MKGSETNRFRENKALGCKCPGKVIEPKRYRQEEKDPSFPPHDPISQGAQDCVASLLGLRVPNKTARGLSKLDATKYLSFPGSRCAKGLGSTVRVRELSGLRAAGGGKHAQATERECKSVRFCSTVAGPPSGAGVPWAAVRTAF